MQSESATPRRITERAASVEYTAIRKMFERAAQYEEKDLVHLEIGEPDFDTPKHIVDAASDAAAGGDTHYTSTPGIDELRAAIAERPGGTGKFDPETEITVTTGGMEALYLALQTVAGPGDDVVLPTPTWPNYITQVRLAGATPVEVPMSADSGFDLDPDRVVEAISEDTTAVVLSSPSNPTGRVYSKHAVFDVIEAAVANDCYVIADEVYDGLVYGDHPTGIPAYTDYDDYVLTVNSCSKKYAMTGWRLGWLAGPADVVEAATKVHGCTTACAPSISQRAALAALTGPQDAAQDMAAAFQERRDYVAGRIADLPGISAPPPEGAMYAFLDVEALPGTSFDIAKQLLDEYGVVTAPGEGFGDAGQGHLRISFANSKDRLELGFDRIEQYLVDNLGDD